MPIFIEKDIPMEIPELVTVEQYFENEHIEDIEGAVRDQLNKQEILKKIKRGQSIAIAVGSRGIDNIFRIVKATVDVLIALETYPFIVPAMGSHGGGTTEGQIAILESFGITQESIGVPIAADQGVERIGTTKAGIPVVIDKSAKEADMIIVINRVKVHTDFSGKYESGLCKMLAIGLGKHKGCSRYHKEGFDSFPELLPEIASVIIQNANVGFGLAIIENARGKTALIKTIPADKIITEEPKLLALSKKLKPSIMIPEIDLLIVDEIGKDLSGGGLDPKITGILGYNDKWRLEDFDGPKISRVFVLGLSQGTHGNASGIGIADIALKSIFEQIDLVATYSNAIASGTTDSVRIPMMLDSIEEGILAAFFMSGYDDISKLKIVRIKNTLHLYKIQVSRNLLHIVARNKRLSISKDTNW